MISEKRLYEILVKRSRSLRNLKPSQASNFGVNNKNSAVLVIVHYNLDNVPSIILTKRSSKLRNHAGEISFPGGRVCSLDESFLDTAIRETFEEIGLLVKKENIVGYLAPTNTYTSKILIYPFIVIIGKIPLLLVPNEEVEQIIEIPIERLCNSIVIDEEHSKKDDNNIMFKFQIDNMLIWGATARILKDLLDLIEYD